MKFTKTTSSSRAGVSGGTNATKTQGWSGKAFTRKRSNSTYTPYQGAYTDAQGVDHPEVQAASNTVDENVDVNLPSAAPFVAAVPRGIVFFTGLGLVVANNIKNGRLKKIWDLVNTGPVNTPPDVGPDLKVVGGELLFVFILSYVAQISPDADNVIFALFVALWFVWGINNADLLVKWTSGFQPTTIKG